MIASVIIKSKIKERVTNTVVPEWGRVCAVPSDGGRISFHWKELTPAEAKREIEADGLQEAYRDKYGIVYDTPDGAFKAMFPGGLTGPEKKALEELDRH